MSRILLNPEDVEGGSASRDEVVTVSRREWEDLVARAGVGADPSADAVPVAAAPAARERIEALSREREEAHDRELAVRDRKVADWERAFKTALKEKELAAALAGRPLVPGAASQLIKLLRDEFDVFDDDGEFRVAARDGRPVSKAVGEMLAAPEFGHFCRPSSRGGTAVQGTNRPLAGAGGPPPPRTLGEAAVYRWREASAVRAGDPSAPIGLRRR